MSMRCADERGYAMAALLVGMSVMGVVLGMALPVWRTAAQREREAELIFRGEQYAHAIDLFSRKSGGYPPKLDVLESGRFIRKLYKDPITDADFRPVYLGEVTPGQPVVPGQPGQPGRGAPPLIPQQPGRAGQPAGGLGQPGAQTSALAGAARPGQAGVAAVGPIIGVVSTSTAQSLRLYNGRGRYNEWVFVATVATQQAGAPTGAQTPAPQGPGGRAAGPQFPGRSGRGVAPAPGPGVPPRRGAPTGPFRGFPTPGSGPASPGRF